MPSFENDLRQQALVDPAVDHVHARHARPAGGHRMARLGGLGRARPAPSLQGVGELVDRELAGQRAVHDQAVARW